MHLSISVNAEQSQGGFHTQLGIRQMRRIEEEPTEAGISKLSDSLACIALREFVIELQAQVAKQMNEVLAFIYQACN